MYELVAEVEVTEFQHQEEIVDSPLRADVEQFMWVARLAPK